MGDYDIIKNKIINTRRVYLFFFFIFIILFILNFDNYMNIERTIQFLKNTQIVTGYCSYVNDYQNKSYFNFTNFNLTETYTNFTYYQNLNNTEHVTLMHNCTVGLDKKIIFKFDHNPITNFYIGKIIIMIGILYMLYHIYKHFMLISKINAIENDTDLLFKNGEKINIKKILKEINNV